MAKKALLTIDGVHRKVTKGLLTVDGVYHKVKKAYLTVGGVWRPCWSDGFGIAYYGQITPMNSYGRQEFGTASNGSYALFANGITSSEYTKSVVAYNASLVRSTASSSGYSQYPQGGRVGNTAIFHGGTAYDEDGEGNYATSFTFSCDASLTIKSTYSGVSQDDHKAATAGNYVVFYGGRYYSEWYDADADEWYTDNWMINGYGAYTESLTAINEKNTGELIRFPAGASVGNYAVFGGGFDGNDEEINTVVAVNGSLEHTTRSLSAARYGHTATNVGNYALFIGGFNNSDGVLDTVDAFDASLTRTAATPISTASEFKVATTILVDGAEYAVIAGGVNDIGSVYDVDVYDASLTRTTYSNVFNSDTRPSGGHGRSNALTPVGHYILYARNNVSDNGRVDALLVG